MPYLTLPYCTLPYLTVPYLTVPYLTIPYRTLPYLTLHIASREAAGLIGFLNGLGLNLGAVGFAAALSYLEVTRVVTRRNMDRPSS